MSDPAVPVLVQAETLVFDDDAGTVSAGLLATEVSENPALTVDQIIAILWPSPSAQPLLVGLIETANDADAPFRLVAIQTPEKLPPQLASVPRVAQLPTHLARGGGGVVDYVLSTKAGTGRAVPFWEAVLSPLLRFAAEALSQDTEPDHVVVTESNDSVREYARGKHAAAKDGPRTVVLLSGDGGVVDLLNSSPPEKEGKDEAAPPLLPTIVLIPLGTGNALFNSLHKPLFTGPSELVLALRTLLSGVAAPLPTFHASFPPGSRIVKYMNRDESSSGAETPSEVAAAEAQLYRHETDVAALHGSIVASYGFHASIVYESDTPAYRAHGAARFGMVAQELLKESHPYAAEVSIRRPGAGAGELERVPRDVHAYVLAALVSNLERTFTISPAGKPLDGQLRLVHFTPLGPERTMEAMMKAYDGGKHVDAQWEDGLRVHYDDIEELAIRVEDEEERWRKVCIDGTIVDIPKGGTVRVRREEKSRFNIVVDSRVI
ncbi:Diacylglycerol kinase, catalytic region [Cordyceps fumosorosea ARSEF 2679]|uniref:Diacylglycerol kinase, catalytic region n=1 Tax=Cordyceps fumosorosea (strain ARSEF 2679) TaxID=1081104 RepID=A0A168AKQ1_CORFA|nr:Diacylglycerol kinase, catalytic region [Cordyceps fumosorosea ARSEF 2679]OAA68881.1 Diacylglycerol kinase, catalytic region [Cordyceps fumosorosea ARSEF 2679]